MPAGSTQQDRSDSDGALHQGHRRAPVARVLSNSICFPGVLDCSLILGREDALSAYVASSSPGAGPVHWPEAAAVLPGTADRARGRVFRCRRSWRPPERRRIGPRRQLALAIAPGATRRRVRSRGTRQRVLFPAGTGPLS